MKVNRSKIIREIKKVWPHLVDGLPDPTNIAAPDGHYWLPTMRDVKEFVWDTYFEKYRYKAEVFDCDDFALLLQAYVRQDRYMQIEKRNLSKDEWFSRAIGQVWGTRFRGIKMRHAINICITRDEGILILEPQDDRLWKADPDMDHVHFIRM